ncbi:TolC family protein [bacterium]|nr:TolC family protein [bacterium]
MSFRNNLLILLLIVVSTLALSAETFTLQECIDRSLKESEKIKALQESEEAAKSGKNGSIFSFLPTATLDAGMQWLKYDPEGVSGVDPTSGQTYTVPFPGKSRTLGITVVQPITPLWSVSYGYKSLETAYDIAKIQRELSSDQLKLEVMNLFYNYQLLNESMDILNETKEQLQKYYEQAKNFYDAGVVDKRSVLKIEIEMTRLEQQIQTVTGNTNLIKKNMALLINVPMDSFELEKTEVSEKNLSADNSQLEKIMLDNRLEYKLLEKSESVYEYSEKLAVQPLIPTLALVAGYKKNWDATSSQPEDTLFIGGTLSWTFGFDWGKTAFDIKQSKHKKVQTQLENAATKKQLSLQLMQLENDVEIKAMAIEISKREIESAAENLRIEEDKYKAKMTTETDLLNASVSLRSAKLGLLTALYEHEVALHTLAITIGTEYGNITEGE